MSDQNSSNYQPGLSAKLVKKKYALSKVIKLASNENPLGPSVNAANAARKEIQSLNRYPDGKCFDLVDEIKKYHKKYTLNNTNIIIGNGSNEILELIARTFLTNDSEAIISKHSFLVYKIICNSMKAKIVEANINKKNNDYFMTVNLDLIKEKITSKTKVIFIANPSNPTGTIIDTVKLEQFLKKIPKKIIVVIDEAYIEYACYRGHISALGLIRDYKNIIITRSFSKIYAIAGSRVGYGISQADIIQKLNSMRQPFNVNQIAQIMAINSLKDKKFLKDSLESNKKCYEFITRELDKDSIKYIDSYTNFITIYFGKNASFIFQELLKKGIILRPLNNYGLPNYLRVTIGTMSECKTFIKNLRILLKRIR
tara:strand:- start:814 stop:1920 length:1107 start_codon:yes stop_codon:yes gene_type:complete